MNWQPIETIPRDGSTVLVCMPGSTDNFFVVAWEDDEDNDLDPAWRCPQRGIVLLTDEEIAACHLRPMWCAVTHPPTSLSAGQRA
jgi:hypothetical protein